MSEGERPIHPFDERDLGAFIPAVLDDSDLSPIEMRVYLRLCRRAGGGHGAFESLNSMADSLEMSRSSVQRALQSLEGRKLIAKHERARPDGGHGTNVYRILPLAGAILTVPEPYMGDEKPSKTETPYVPSEHSPMFPENTPYVPTEHSILEGTKKEGISIGARAENEENPPDKDAKGTIIELLPEEYATPEVKAAFKRYFSFRASMRWKPWKALTMEANISKWQTEGFTASEIADALDTSVANVWQGVFPKRKPATAGERSSASIAAQAPKSRYTQEQIDRMNR